MNLTIRRIAVSGAAAVALLGAAGTATAAVTEDHEATVVAIAKTDTQDPSGITNGLTPDGGQGAAIQNPVDGLQPNGVTGQQIQTQASGAAIGTGVVAIAILGIIVFFRVKGGHMKVGDLVVVTLLGVALAGTVIGGMADQITDSGVASLGGILGGL
jgi:hypothetical protein